MQVCNKFHHHIKRYGLEDKVKNWIIKNPGTKKNPENLICYGKSKPMNNRYRMKNSGQRYTKHF